MVSLLSSPCTFTINVDRIVEALGKALGFVDERTQSFDWLAYYRSISEWRRARDEERLFRWFYIDYEFQTFEPFDYLLADFVARIRALRERMWRMLSRTSQCEGRFESLLASMPTPPTINAAGRLNGYTYTLIRS